MWRCFWWFTQQENAPYKKKKWNCLDAFFWVTCLLGCSWLLACSWLPGLIGLALLFLQLGTSQGFQHLWQRHVQLCHGEGSKVKESAKLMRLWEMNGDTYGNLHSCTEFYCLVSGMHLSIFFGEEMREIHVRICSKSKICSGLLT